MSVKPNFVGIVGNATSSVFDILETLSTLEKQAIVRPENPPPGVAGFVFDLVENDEINLSSNITDHYVENNTAIQDHIALAPEEISVRGVIAELTYVPSNTNTEFTVPISDPLVTISDFLPELTTAQTETDAQTQAASTRESEAITSPKSRWGMVATRYGTEIGTQNFPTAKQSRGYNYFDQLWRGRQLCTVETPWGFWTNMAISKVAFIQEAKSRYVSNVAITFKKMRFAQDITVRVGQLAGRAASQRSDTTQNGTAGKESVTTAKKQSLAIRLGGG